MDPFSGNISLGNSFYLPWCPCHISGWFISKLDARRSIAPFSKQLKSVFATNAHKSHIGSLVKFNMLCNQRCVAHCSISMLKIYVPKIHIYSLRWPHSSCFDKILMCWGVCVCVFVEIKTVLAAKCKWQRLTNDKFWLINSKCLPAKSIHRCK